MTYRSIEASSVFEYPCLDLSRYSVALRLDRSLRTVEVRMRPSIHLGVDFGRLTVSKVPSVYSTETLLCHHRSGPWVQDDGLSSVSLIFFCNSARICNDGARSRTSGTWR